MRLWETAATDARLSATPELAKMNIYGHQEGHEIGWRTMAGYLDAVEAGKPTVNVASLVPNGNLRLSVAGLVDRPSTPDELNHMKSLLAQSMEEGAFGFSTGLEYGARKGTAPQKRKSSNSVG